MRRALIAAPSVSSVSPAFDMSNRDVATQIAEWLERIGCAVELQEIDSFPGKFNVIGTLGKGPGGLVLAGHRWGPAAAVAVGLPLTIGFALVHFLPDGGAVSDSFPSGAVAARTVVDYRGVEKTARLTRVIVAVVLAALATVVAASLSGGQSTVCLRPLIVTEIVFI